MTFYLPDFETPVLPENESLHCLKVLRLGKSDLIQVVNGKGRQGLARIADPHPKKCRLEMVEETLIARTHSPTLWLGVAPTKNLDRMEWMVEKGTEIGCDGFLFIRTARTERDHLNLERLEKIAVSAMKQSGQAWLPEIEWVNQWKSIPWGRFNRIVTADLSTENTHLHLDPGDRCLILIGPEGDFTPAELEDLKALKAESIRLRPQVLRTETAAIFALSMAHLG